MKKFVLAFSGFVLGCILTTGVFFLIGLHAIEAEKQELYDIQTNNAIKKGA